MEMEAGEKGETWIQVGSLFAPKLSHRHQITTALPNFVTLAAGAAEQDIEWSWPRLSKENIFKETIEQDNLCSIIWGVHRSQTLGGGCIVYIVFISQSQNQSFVRPFRCSIGWFRCSSCFWYTIWWHQKDGDGDGFFNKRDWNRLALG